MKCNYPILILSTLLLGASSCSYQQFGAVATGSSLGGMFGSSIGGLMGGPRGSDKGTLAGMVIGGAIGAAVTAPRDQSSSRSQAEQAESYDDVDVYNRRGRTGEVQYDSYNNPRYQSPAAAASDLGCLEVTNVHFLDANGNQCLDRDEEAYIVMDIYNRGARTLYNVAPNISCTSRRVAISPAAAIASLPSGQGVRYKAAVKTTRRISDPSLLFTVSFGTGKQAVTAKQFKIKTTL